MERAIVVFQYFDQGPFADEVARIFRRALEKKKFESVLWNLENHIRDFILRQDIPACMTSAERKISSDPTAILLLRINSYILCFVPPAIDEAPT